MDAKNCADRPKSQRGCHTASRSLLAAPWVEGLPCQQNAPVAILPHPDTISVNGKEPHVGDKGGKKDKAKGQKQKSKKQQQEAKKNQDKQPKRTP